MICVTRKLFDALSRVLFRTGMLWLELDEALGRSCQRGVLLTERKPDQILPGRGIPEETAAWNRRDPNIFYQKPREFHIIGQSMTLAEWPNITHDVVGATGNKRFEAGGIQHAK